MSRNTIIFILFLGICAAVVAGVNLGKIGNKIPSPSPSVVQPTNEPTPNIPTLLSYESTACGISFSYPETLTKIDVETGGATFVNTNDTKETIVVVCQKDIPRVPLAADKIENLKIGSVSAKLYHDASQKDGTPIDKLIFTHPKLRKDVYLAGLGSTYEAILQSLKLYP